MAAILNNSKEDIIYFKDEVLKDVKQFALELLSYYKEEVEDIVLATSKVRGVI